MKHILLSFGALILAFSTSATIRNVSNSPNAPVNPPYTYNSFADAVDAASDGDTLYLHGTNVSYGSVTISNKELVIIGAGYGSNLQNSNNLATIVGTINFTDYTGTKNVSLIGLRMDEPKNGVAATNKVNVLYIERCGIRPVPNSTNKIRCNTLFLKQSVLGDQTIPYNDEFSPIVAATAYISNCVIQGIFNGGGIAAAVFENNIFKRSYSGSTYSNSEIKSINGTAVFNNNIFLANYGPSVSNCTFNNNVFENITGLTSSNTGSNNIFNTSPGLISSPNPNGMVARSNFSTSANYRLTNNSVCIGAGIGGTDIGIYGGTDPIPMSMDLNGVPQLPRIIQMTIQNMSVAPGGNLNVQIQAVNQK